jgi:hypothetical protein
MVRVMDSDRLLEYHRGVWEEIWDATLFEVKAVEARIP